MSHEEHIRLLNVPGPFFLVIVLLVTMPAWAGTGFGTSAAFVLDTRGLVAGGLSGYVMEMGAQGQPLGAVPGATVAVSGGPSVLTDAQGAFFLGELAAGVYTVTASKTGFHSVARQVALYAHETRSEVFQLSRDLEGVPRAYDFNSARGDHLIEGMPGNLTFETLVAWNGTPGTVRFQIAGEWHAANVTDLGGGVARATLNVPAPASIEAVSEWQIEAKNGEGQTNIAKPGVFFYPVPKVVRDWYQGSLIWGLTGNSLDCSREIGVTLWNVSIPSDVFSTEAGYSESLSLAFDPEGGAFEAERSAAGSFEATLEFSGVENMGAGQIEGTGTLECNLKGFAEPSVSGTLSLDVEGRAGLGAPVILVVDAVFPPAAPFMATLRNTPVVGDVLEAAKLRFFLIGGLGAAGHWTEDGGPCWLGASSYDVYGTLGAEVQALLSIGDDAGVGIYAGGTGTPAIQVCPEWQFQGVTLQGYVGVFANVYLFSFSEEVGWEMELWAPEPGTGAVMQIYPDGDTKSLGQWRPIGGSLLEYGAMNRQSSLKGARQMTQGFLNGTGGGSEETIIENVSLLSAPAVQAKATEVVVLFALHDPVKPWHEATDIAQVSAPEGANWTLSRVTDDLNAEFSPALADVGIDTVLAAWARVSGDVSAADGPEDILPHLEIVAARRDAAGVWGVPEPITDNAQVDRDPVMVVTDGTQGVLWVQNESGVSPGDATHGDRLLYASWTGAAWGAPQTLWSGAKGILKHTFTARGDGEGIVAFAVDEDGDLETKEDRELYAVWTDGGVWQGAVRLTNNEVEDSLPVLMAPDGAVLCVWKQADTLLYSPMASWNPREVYSEQGPANRAPSLAGVTMPGGVAIGYTVQGPSGVDVVAAFYDSAIDRWSQPRQLTNDEAGETSISMGFDGSELVLAYLKTETLRADVEVEIDGVIYPVEDVPQPGRTDLCVLRHQLGYDLAVGETSLVLEPANPVPGMTAVVRATVENRGDLSAQGVEAALYDGDPLAGGVLIDSAVIDGILIAGTSQDVSFEWTVPSELRTYTLYVVVDPGLAVDDRDRSNNATATPAVLPDLVSASSSSTPVSNTSVVLSTRILNQGAISSAAFRVNWVHDTQDGEIIGTTLVDGLEAGAFYDATFVWEIGGRVFEEDFTTVYIVLDPEDAVFESDEPNNISLQSVRVRFPEEGESYTVTFDSQGGTVPVPPSKQVVVGKAYGALATTSREGYDSTGWHKSSGGGDLVTADTIVTIAADHTLYAQWTVQTREVPNVVGLPLAEAEPLILASNLVVGLVTEQYSDEVPAGHVISQVPLEGTVVAFGSSVDLVVSRGPCPGKISSIEQLQLIGDDPAYPLDGDYILTQDIDAAATAGWNGGAGFAPIGTDAMPFTGTFDGQGHVITGLTIYRPDTDFVGLFGLIGQGGTVQNLEVRGGALTGNAYVGGLVGSNGWYDLGGTITQCHATCVITGEWVVGGLVGMSWYGTLSECYATGAVTGCCCVGGLVGATVYGTVSKCYATGAVTGESDQVGGLVGSNGWYGSGGTVSQCYATGAVTGYVGVGGLVGYHCWDGVVYQSYSISPITGTGGAHIGGLVGYLSQAAVESSFWDIDLSGMSISDGGTGLPTAQMQTLSTFTDAGWDFDAVWYMLESGSYPYLGALQVVVPDVSAMSEADALAALEAAGLLPSVTHEYSETVPEGHVVSQNPPAASQINPGTGVHVVVSLGPAAPIARDDSYTTCANMPLSVAAPGVLGNDTGPQGTPLEAVLVGKVSHGALTLNLDGSFEYVPKGGYVQADSFTYVANNGELDSNVATVTITVAPPGSVPISSVGQLQLIGHDPAYPLDGYYVLTDDIDALATATWNSGAGFDPIGTFSLPFAGTFDGQGHVITGLTINRPGRDYIGLFGAIGPGGRVQGLGIEGGTITGRSGVGGLAGFSQGGTVFQCYATCAVSGIGTVGGLVGDNRVGSDGGTISQCYTTGTLTGTENVVGGLVGQNYGGTISESYSMSQVSGASYVGGLVGYNLSGGSVSECYSMGAVTGAATDIGGLVGYNSSGTVNASFWDIETSGTTVSAGGTGLPTALMQTQSTFTDAGWDFDAVWYMLAGGSYPYLLFTLEDMAATRSFWYYKYASPGVEEITVTVENLGLDDLSAFALVEELPPGWAFDSVVSFDPPGCGPATIPSPGATGTLEFVWSCIPEFPYTFTYRVNVPSGQTGDKILSGDVLYQRSGSPQQTAAIGGLSLVAEREQHTLDHNPEDNLISVSEILRVIQFYNLGGYHCAVGTEDGYEPGLPEVPDNTCAPHDSDYNPQDWKISVSEILRVIQFYNLGGYHVAEGTEDGYAPGLSIKTMPKSVEADEKKVLPPAVILPALYATREIAANGDAAEVTVTFTGVGADPISALGLLETLPEGWIFEGIVDASEPPAIAPVEGALGELEFVWIWPPAMPAQVTYRISSDAGKTGLVDLTGKALYRTSGIEQQAVVAYGPPQTFYADANAIEQGNGTSDKPFATISEAITATVGGRGDTIVVRPGAYRESTLVLPPFTAFTGEAGPYSTQLSGADSESSLIVATEGCMVRGLTAHSAGVALRVCAGMHAEITNCVLHTNGVGLLADEAASVVLANNTIYGNAPYGAWGGPGATFVLLANNLFAGNDTGLFAGAGALQSAGYNDWSGNGLDLDGPAGSSTDFSADPLFVDVTAFDLRLGDGSPCRDAGDPGDAFRDTDGTRNDIGAEGGPYGLSGALAQAPPELPPDDDETSIAVRGDVNRDGKVDAIDLQLVINATLGITQTMIGYSNAVNCDTDGSGTVNAVDVQTVLNLALKQKLPKRRVPGSG